MPGEYESLKNKLLALKLFPLRTEEEVEAQPGETHIPKKGKGIRHVSVPVEETPHGRNERLRGAAEINSGPLKLPPKLDIKPETGKVLREILREYRDIDPHKLTPRTRRDQLAGAIRTLHAVTSYDPGDKKLTPAEQNLLLGEWLKSWAIIHKYEQTGLYCPPKGVVKGLKNTALEKVLGRPIPELDVPGIWLDRWKRGRSPNDQVRALARKFDPSFMDEARPAEEVKKALEYRPPPPPPPTESDSAPREVRPGGEEGGVETDGRIEELIEHTAGGDDDPGGTGRFLDINRPPLSRVVKGVMMGGEKSTRREIGPRVQGKLLYQAMTTPGAKVFKKMMPWKGGTVAIDCSGSMRMTTSQIDAILDVVPGCTIVGYEGMDDPPNHGHMIVLADRGRRIDLPPGDVCVGGLPWERIKNSKYPRPYVGGNAIDDLVVKWLLRRPGHRLFICDGGYTCFNPEKVTRLVTSAVGVGLLTWARSVAEAVELVRRGKWPALRR